jgi:hypothetical protein
MNPPTSQHKLPCQPGRMPLIITQDKLSQVAPPDHLDDKNATHDEGTYIEGDDFLEISLDTSAKESSERSETITSLTQWISKTIINRSYPPEPGVLRLPRNWKPIMLQYPALLNFIIISLSLIAILEVLYHFSKGDNGGGLAFGTTVNDLSTTASFSYLYLPTVLAVVYSLLWNWIDLDAKRLEPWFQLSGYNGATAANSLLLHYPFEFLAFVPIHALRRRYIRVS